MTFASGQRRPRLFVRGIEETFPRELFLQLFKGDLQVAHALRHHAGGVELIDAVAREHRHAPENRYAHAVFRPEAKLERAALEHHAAQAALAVLQREVMMAGGIDLIVRQLAAYADVQKRGIGLQKSADVLVELRDREDRVPFGHACSACCGSSARTNAPSTPLTKATVSGSS